MSNLDPAEELAVRSLVGRYADAVNTADATEWGSTWADSGEWHIGGKDLVGRQAIVEFWRSAMAGFESVIQMVGQGRVAAGGASAASGGAAATGRWTIWEIGRKSGGGTLVVGCYEDRYVKEGGDWRFAARTFTATYRGQVPAGEFFAFPEPAALT